MQRPLTAAILAASALLLPAASAHAQCAPHIADTYRASRLSGSVQTSALFDDGSGPTLYIAGRLTINGATCTVAKLVNGQWTALPSILGLVNTLQVIDNGTGPALYAGGSFNLTPQGPAVSVAKFDGTAWTALPATTPVDAMAWYPQGPSGALYVGGGASSTSGGTLRRLVGSTWEAVPNAVSGAPFSVVIRSLVVHDDGSGSKLYIAGRFATAGGQAATGIATFDGTTCSPLGAGYGSGNYAPDIHSIVIHNDGSGPAIYIAGVIDLPARNYGNTLVAKLAGNVWTSVLPADLVAPNHRGSRALLSLTDAQGPALYVATGSHVESASQVRVLRNGAWQLVGPAFSGQSISTYGPVVNTLTTVPSPTGPKVLALGDFTANTPLAVPSVAQLEGPLWRNLEPRAQGLATSQPFFSDPASSDGTIHTNFYSRTPGGWAGNQFPFDAYGGVRAEVQGQSQFVIWSYLRIAIQSPEGSTDLALPPNFAYGPLAAVDSGSGPELYAFHFNQSRTNYLLSKYAGSVWTNVGSALATSNCVPTGLVAYDSGSGPRLYASFRSPAGSANLFEIDGNQSSPLSLVDGPIHALNSFDLGNGPELIIAGDLAPSGSTAYNGLARWNGSRTDAIASGLNTGAIGRALVTINTPAGPQLWAGGANGLVYAYWNGSTWTRPYSISNTSTPSVVSISPVKNPDGSQSIFLAGSFSQFNGVSSLNFAEIITCPPSCTADFDSDGDYGTDADIEAFFACLAGNCCPTCATADFNNDGDYGTDADIESFFRVLAGGPC